MRVVIVIPARYESTRFPGKPLVKIANKPLIQWVYESAKQILGVQQIIVATDDPRIADAVINFSGNVVITPKDISNGSERVGFVAKDLDADIIVNLQGDEPLISADDVANAIHTIATNPQLNVVTLGYSLQNEAEWRNPAIVKVVVDEQMNAIYFSRAPIPHFRDSNFQAIPRLFGHIGVYVYRKSFLLEYLDWPEGVLEKYEKLEQLRILDRGYKIKVVVAGSFSPGVDRPEDIPIIEKMLKKKG